jgi:hypothetical protein
MFKLKGFHFSAATSLPGLSDGILRPPGFAAAEDSKVFLKTVLFMG